MSEMEKIANLPQDQRVLLAPLVRTTKWFWIWAGMFSAVTLWGAGAYLYQLRRGLYVTGLNTPEYWGIYIICFVFFIGISHAGTLISAILRISKAEWRRAITRSAEFITVLVIAGCGRAPAVEDGPSALPVDVYADTGRTMTLRATPPPSPGPEPRASVWLARVSPSRGASLELPSSEPVSDTLAFIPSTPPALAVLVADPVAVLVADPVEVSLADAKKL